MDLRSKKEIFFFHNDLTCLALGLVGQVTTVDLRNEASVTGLLDQVDGYMNIVMIDAVYVDGANSRHYFDFFFIKARNVRYIHIPEEVQVIPTIHNQLRILQGKRTEQVEKPKRTFRQSRLQRQQRETLKLVEEEKRKKAEQKKST